MTRLAIYAGSFDPPTNGHMDIVSRAAEVFSHLVVAVGVNSEKEPFLPVEERVEALRACCGMVGSHVEVATFDGLLVEYARSRGCRVLVRGLRAITDFDYEFRIALANRRLAPEVETMFLVAREEHSFLASSVVKEVARLGGDYRQFVPGVVGELISARMESAG